MDDSEKYKDDKVKGFLIPDFPDIKINPLEFNLSDYALELENEVVDSVEKAEKAEKDRMAIIKELCQIKELTKNQKETESKKMGENRGETIRWKGKNIQLAYLLKSLKKEGYFQDNADFWKWASNVFLDKDGKPFKENVLQQAIANYEQRRKRLSNKIDPENE